MKKNPKQAERFRQEACRLPDRRLEQERCLRRWNTFYETWRFRQWNKN